MTNEIHTVTKEDLETLKNDMALSLHVWVRDTTAGHRQPRKNAVLNALESLIASAIGTSYTKIDGRVLNRFTDYHTPSSIRRHS